MKLLTFFLFLRVVFALLYPDPRIQPSKVNAVPDPQHWLFLLENQGFFFIMQFSLYNVFRYTYPALTALALSIVDLLYLAVFFKVLLLSSTRRVNIPNNEI
jgi:hypothetical protein